MISVTVCGAIDWPKRWFHCRQFYDIMVWKSSFIYSKVTLTFRIDGWYFDQTTHTPSTSRIFTITCYRVGSWLLSNFCCYEKRWWKIYSTISEGKIKAIFSIFLFVSLSINFMVISILRIRTILTNISKTLSFLVAFNAQEINARRSLM